MSQTKRSFELNNDFMDTRITDLNTGQGTSPDKTGNEPGSSEDGGHAGNRVIWGRQVEFILTCIGFAVGLGNVWRFPYLCYRNGGGAFLIPYAIMLFVVGIPIFFLELAFGQFASHGPISIWSVNPVFKGLGFCVVSIAAIIPIYYNIVIAYCFFYLFASMTSVLPWVSCDNDWNSCECKRTDLDLDLPQNDSFLWVNYTRPECQEEYRNGTKDISNITTESPTTEYFENYVLQQSSGMEEPGILKWQLALCLMLTWIVVFAVLIKGVRSLGKIVYFTATFPYVLLTVLLVRGATLPGSLNGINYYLMPKWELLKEASVWSDAASQIFFSLCACCGGLITMASYNKFNNNCMRDAIIIPIINCLTSFYAGFVIFSVLGFMADQKNIDISKVAVGGPGLAFVVYPEAIARMDVAPLWSILFFFMMLTLGFSSTFGAAETVLTAFVDEYGNVLKGKWRIMFFRALLCVIGFFLGLPMCLQSGMYLQNLMDNSLGGYPLLVAGIFELIAINWVYGYKRFAEDIKMMIGRRPFIIFKFAWCVVSPGLLLAVIVFRVIQTKPGLKLDEYVYPDWALALGWLIVAFTLVWVPGWAVPYLLHKAGFFRYIRAANKPLPSWGPLLKANRTGRYRDYTGNLSHENSHLCDSADDDTEKAEIAREDSGIDGSQLATGYVNTAFSQDPEKQDSAYF